MKEKMIIGICDDKPETIITLKNYIEVVREEQKEDWEIRNFYSGGELLEKVEELSVVFLDIEMPELDGIETGRGILRKNPDCKIIMATGITERFKEAFQIGAVRFVTKPFVMEEVREALSAALNQTWKQRKVELFWNRIVYQIPQKEICFVRAMNGYTEYAVDGRWMRKPVTLDEAEKLLDGCAFARVSRQYLVNLAYVKDYKDGLFYILDKKFKTARRLKKNFEQKYIEFDLKYR